jgi:hypothetical protein
MLPSFRLIIATFLTGFVLAAVAVQFIGTARLAHDGLAPEAAPANMRAEVPMPASVGAIDRLRADMPVPVIFDLRFAADISAIAANPVGLARPAAPGIAAPSLAVPSNAVPSAAAPNVAVPSVAAPDVAVPRSDPEPAPDPAPAMPPNDGLTGDLPEEPDPDPLASLTVAPNAAAMPAAAQAAPPDHAASNRAARPAVQPRAQPRPVRRAPSSEPNATAAANPLWSLFSGTPQAPQ